MVTPRKIQNAYYDNVRNNQIGGMTDGISPEVAADLGYETPERTAEILSTLGKITSPAEIKLTQPDDTKSRELPKEALEAIAIAHEVGTRTSKRLMQSASLTAEPYVSRALRGQKVDGNRRANKRGR